MTNAPTAEDARAIEMLKAGGILNPNVTLDKLMDVTRQLAEAGLSENILTTYFAGAYYVYKVTSW
jgi:hypothetical protein